MSISFSEKRRRGRKKCGHEVGILAALVQKNKEYINIIKKLSSIESYVSKIYEKNYQTLDKVLAFVPGLCFYIRMLKRQSDQQSKIELVSIGELVPQDHHLRKIDKAINFSFIYDKVKDLYCQDNGRPCIDPVVLFKMLFIGYLFGIRSEQRLVKEIEVNVAYRWFLGFTLTDKVPHASTFSQNRRRRFNESSVYQDIFDEIVYQAIRRRMVDGKTLYTDSTHLKASANKGKYDKKLVLQSTRGYIEELERDITADREKHGKKPLPARESAPATKEIKVSTTDPESGYLVREGKPKGFFYLDHRTVDGKCAIITDTFVTAGNVHDSQPYLDRLDRQRKQFGFKVQAAGLDAGYFTPHICKGLMERTIYGVIGYSRPTHREGYLRKKDFTYDEAADCYLCPQNQILCYRTTNRDGYCEYVSEPSICRACELLGQCTTSKNCVKIVTRHVWQDYKDEVNSHRYEDRGKAIYKRRKETVERSFADGKELHGHRYARFRGLSRVQAQCLLSAACQNMKKIALLLWRKGQTPAPESFSSIKQPVSTVFTWLKRIFVSSPDFTAAA
jgi:transposase